MNHHHCDDAMHIAGMRAAFAAQQDAFLSDMLPSAAVRLERLDRLFHLTRRHEEGIVRAIADDFGHRAHAETRLTDIVTTQAGIRHLQRHVTQWMRPRKVPTPLHMWPATSRVLRQPLGVVGVIAPWNFPHALSIMPAAAAIAAGNRVMIKPSEATPRHTALLQQAVAGLFDPSELDVIPGGMETSQAFSSLPFDHLFFTGSTEVGRHVAVAAARNLTPVTLELGGKSPAIIDDGADFAAAAQRLAHAKLINAGQACVAPDYLFVPRARVDEFVQALHTAIAAMYPALMRNPDYTSIASDRHHSRINRLLRQAVDAGAHAVRIDPTGEQPSARKIHPTLLLNVNDDMDVMREEIFGPLLPIMPYDTVEQAIAYINRHPRPLALYWFGRDAARRDRVLHSTISGGVCINDALWQVVQDHLPFGGVGASGMGSYHGEQGFITFSKEKSVLEQGRISGFPLFRAPYGPRFSRALALLRKFQRI